MSETATEATPDAQQPQDGERTEQAKTFDADYVEKLRKEAAKYRTEAKANAEAAARLAEMEEATKTAEQKAAERLAAAEKAATEAEAKVKRREIAIEHRLNKEDAALLDTITDEDAMRSLAARLTPAEDDGKPRAPKPDPVQGRNTSGSASTGEQFAAAVDGLFSR